MLAFSLLLALPEALQTVYITGFHLEFFFFFGGGGGGGGRGEQGSKIVLCIYGVLGAWFPHFIES